MFKIILTTALLMTSNLLAHEGDHGPSTVQAPKGGIMRSLESVHLELVAKGSEVKIYPYDLKLKSSDLAQFPVSATVAAPKKKPVPAKLVAQGDHWLLQHDIKGAHRYTLNLVITQGGHNDKVKWVIETKK